MKVFAGDKKKMISGFFLCESSHQRASERASEKLNNAAAERESAQACVKTVWCGGLAWDIVGGGFMSIDIYVCERDQTSHEFSIDGSAKTRAS